MAYIERSDEEMIAAWEEWLESHPNPDENCGGELSGIKVSWREIIMALKSGEPSVKAFHIGFFRLIAKKLDKDPIVLIKSVPYTNSPRRIP